jgi:hypothetical protein
MTIAAGLCLLLYDYSVPANEDCSRPVLASYGFSVPANEGCSRAVLASYGFSVPAIELLQQASAC